MAISNAAVAPSITVTDPHIAWGAELEAAESLDNLIKLDRKHLDRITGESVDWTTIGETATARRTALTRYVMTTRPATPAGAAVQIGVIQRHQGDVGDAITGVPEDAMDRIMEALAVLQRPDVDPHIA